MKGPGPPATHIRWQVSIEGTWGTRQQNVTAGSGGPQPQLSFNASTNQNSGDSYDAAGNVTYDGSHSYAYDAEGSRQVSESASRPVAVSWVPASRPEPILPFGHLIGGGNGGRFRSNMVWASTVWPRASGGRFACAV